MARRNSNPHSFVGGFVKPTAGVAKVKGHAITGPGPDRGPVFQEFALFPWKSVLGNVMYGPRQQGLGRRDFPALRCAVAMAFCIVGMLVTLVLS